VDTSASRIDYDGDLIAIGAGPIGLTTARALGHHGINLRVFERRHSRLPGPAIRQIDANLTWRRAPSPWCPSPAGPGLADAAALEHP
jgi:phytoene dehydrogenase-like protein